MTLQPGSIILVSDVLAISATATNALGVANSAVTTADTAIANANTALATAQGISGIANEALSTAQTAETTANSVSGIANEALTNASTAQTTANSALTVANAAIPASHINIANGVAGLDSFGNVSALTVIATGAGSSQTLAQIAYNANHSNYTITGLSTDSSITTSDFLGASDGTNDFKITVTNFIESTGVSVASLPAASTVATTDGFITNQNGTVGLQTAANLASFTLNRLPLYFYPVLEITSNTILDPSVHNNKILVCSSPVTIAKGTVFVGSGFICTVINVSGSAVTLDSSFISSNGVNSIPANGSCQIIAATYSSGNIYFADLGSSSTPNLGIAVGVAQSSLPTGVSISVIGTINPANTAVQIAISTQNITAPSSGWQSATVSGYNFTGSISGQSNGTYYIWARETNTTSTNAVSGAVVVSTYSVAITSAPSTGNTGTPYTSSGTLSPSSQAVQVQFGSSNTSIPTGAWTSASVSGTNWTASFTPGSTGTVYLWAQQTVNPSVTAVSSAIVISAPANSVAFTSPPSTAIQNQSLTINGTVYPGSSAVQIQFGTSKTVAPTGSWSSVTVTGTTWTTNISAPSSTGTYYLWAEQTANTSITAVTPAIVISAPASPAIAYEYGVTSFGISSPTIGSYAHYAGTNNSIPITFPFAPAQGGSAVPVIYWCNTQVSSFPTVDGTNVIDTAVTNPIIPALINSQVIEAYINPPASTGSWYLLVGLKDNTDGNDFCITTAFTIT